MLRFVVVASLKNHDDEDLFLYSSLQLTNPTKVPEKNLLVASFWTVLVDKHILSQIAANIYKFRDTCGNFV